MATIQSYATPRDGLHAAENDITVFCVMAGVRKWLDALSRPGKKRVPYSQTCPTISTERMLVSLADRPFELKQIVHSASKEPSSEETVLYLGYGSNMSAETFRGKRNIKPISQVNAIIPRLALTFDLPGVPYSEPCFANVRYRHPAESEKSTRHPPYRKDQWTKGLIGVVYEVTKADFAHIIATEGGGAAYQDVLVDCYTLKEDPEEEVHLEPQGPAFKAHTLFCPPNAPRPDPSYAQPSPRYLKLITDGAKEHKLPHEYQEYLKSIGTYRTTTTQQRLGQFIFLAIWAPIFAFIFGGAGMFLDKNGRYPKWYARFATATFTACWQSYDGFFKETFGDGERTVEKEEPEREIRKKEGLVRYHTRDYGAISS